LQYSIKSIEIIDIIKLKVIARTMPEWRWPAFLDLPLIQRFTGAGSRHGGPDVQGIALFLR
jgi:hypothetical protein